MTKGKSKHEHKLRYQARYYHYVTTTMGQLRAPDAYGSSGELDNLVRNAAGRCAIENYRQAVIVDHHKGGARAATLKRTSTGITITRGEHPS